MILLALAKKKPMIDFLIDVYEIGLMTGEKKINITRIKQPTFRRFRYIQLTNLDYVKILYNEAEVFLKGG